MCVLQSESAVMLLSLSPWLLFCCSSHLSIITLTFLKANSDLRILAVKVQTTNDIQQRSLTVQSSFWALETSFQGQGESSRKATVASGTWVKIFLVAVWTHPKKYFKHYIMTLIRSWPILTFKSDTNSSISELTKKRCIGWYLVLNT